MIDYNLIFSFALAYLVTFALVPIVRVLAFKMNAVDIPKDKRRMHKRPIPRWGGTAIYAGFVVSVACFTPVIDKRLIGILIGSLVIVIIGILDDKFALNPFLKLLGQCVAAVIVIAFGVKINAFNGLLASFNNGLPSTVTPAINGNAFFSFLKKSTTSFCLNISPSVIILDAPL